MTIISTNGHKIFVDRKDFLKLSRQKWCVVFSRGVRPYAKASGGAEKVLMHRQILNAPKGFHVDHIDGDGLNNRRRNLRLCTNSENLCNRGPQKRNKSGHKNIWYDKRRGRYCVDISKNYGKVFRGRFKDLDTAIKARDVALKKYHAAFAGLHHE